MHYRSNLHYRSFQITDFGRVFGDIVDCIFFIINYYNYFNCSELLRGFGVYHLNNFKK